MFTKRRRIRPVRHKFPYRNRKRNIAALTQKVFSIKDADTDTDTYNKNKNKNKQRTKSTLRKDDRNNEQEDITKIKHCRMLH